MVEPVETTIGLFCRSLRYAQENVPGRFDKLNDHTLNATEPASGLPPVALKALRAPCNPLLADYILLR